MNALGKMTERTRTAARRLKENFTFWNWIRAGFWYAVMGAVMKILGPPPKNKRK